MINLKTLLTILMVIISFSSSADFNRHKDFPSTWSTKGKGEINVGLNNTVYSCKLNTRSVLLQKSTKTMEIGSGHICKAITGLWKDAYTGEKYTEAGNVDIDHIVAIKDAWVSGASDWTLEERSRFYNDTENLVIAGKRLNISKGARSPSEWDFNFKSDITKCSYFITYIKIKNKYNLSYSEDDIEYLDDYANDSCKLGFLFEYGLFGKDTRKGIEVRD